MTNVGGDPARMKGGARTLHDVGTLLRDGSDGVTGAANKAAASSGAGYLAGSLRRLGVATGTYLDDSGVQAQLAARLATVSADDLTGATGG